MSPRGGYAQVLPSKHNNARTDREVLQEHVREGILSVLKEEQAKKHHMAIDQGDGYH